jgi:hypothetical protein
MTYQNVQKNMLYILVSKSCIAKQLWTLLNLEEHNEPFFICRVYGIAMLYAFQPYLIWQSCSRV